ncbi:MAG: YbhB/YbcL family Raf kinase inhibitor-like protein [Patescibacteria group bacterium]
MILQSNDFEPDQVIPTKHTCDGEDWSPHLKWSEYPEVTKSFALSCMDPDAPTGNWVHWVMINIPVSESELEEGAEKPTGAIEIANDFGKESYGGPCPPAGTHHYVFVVYALDTDQLIDVTKDNFAAKVQEHTIAKAELIGTYSRE